MTQFIERREDERVVCSDIKVDYKINNRVYSKSIRDISRGGIFVGSDQPVKIGSDVVMVFSDYVKLCLISMGGRIVRGEDEGFAVRFKRNAEEEIDTFIMGLN